MSMKLVGQVRPGAYPTDVHDPRGACWAHFTARKETLRKQIVQRMVSFIYLFFMIVILFYVSGCHATEGGNSLDPTWGRGFLLMLLTIGF